MRFLTRFETFNVRIECFYTLCGSYFCYNVLKKQNVNIKIR